MHTITFPFQSFPELKTPRLLLRDLSEEDYQMMFFLRSDTTVNAYIKREGAKKLEDAIDFMNMVQHGYEKGDNINWAISKKEDQKMIGSICLWNFSEDLKTAEVGYSLHPEYQQQGIMNEAMKAIITFGFTVLNFDRLVAYTHHANLSSLQLLKKNGFILQEEITDPGDENNIVLALDKD
ncbi:GNAT family N-acetyltransferase [Lutimonas sp.]|uniref:GNAT family N-acetyltransferase n=1 Tax=Lutimonas sp. TaxID=1872403 RepID=UPI003D9BFDBB